MASSSTASTSQTAPLDPPTNAQPLTEHSPLLASYNQWIRTLFDTVDRLRNMRIVTRPIQLPKIVVVGAPSSGKSSVLDSLAGGIGLLRSEAISTRVPVFINLENRLGLESKFSLLVEEGAVLTKEEDVTEMIFLAGLGIEELSLVVKKAGVPDLTMVDFPGISEDGVDGERLRNKIMEHISQEESIILCVVSANDDFLTSKAFRMCRDVDPGMKRSILVVTKVDVIPDDLLVKLITDIDGSPYVLVRNRLGDESYAECRDQERMLLRTHCVLSTVHKSKKGIRCLAQNVVRIQGTIISKSIEKILNQINEAISLNMPTSNCPLQTGLKQLLGLAKESLIDIISGRESDGSQDENKAKARFAEMTDQCKDELKSNCEQIDVEQDFLEEMIKMLSEAEAKKASLKVSGVDYAFLKILDKKLDKIFPLLVDFVSKYCHCVTDAVKYVLMKHITDPELQSATMKAAENMIARMKQQSVARLREAVEIERTVHITLNDAYQEIWDDFSEGKTVFLQTLNDTTLFSDKAELAFDLARRVISYWSIVRRRLVDNVTVNMVSAVKKLVEWEMECEILNKVSTEINANLSG